MAIYKFKIDQQSSQWSDSPNGPLKEQFESLKTTIENQLGGLYCHTHNFEPTINLESDGNHVRIGGLGGCCQELTSKAVELIKAVGIDTKDWTHVTVRKEMNF
jgi:hypothetical protein